LTIEALKQQLAEGKITKEQFAAELKKLLDAGTITQEEHDAAAKEAEGGKKDDEPLTADAVQKLIAEAVAKAAQSAEDKTRREYSEKLKKEQEEKERLLKEKMTEEEKTKFELEKLRKENEDNAAKLVKEQVAFHTVKTLATKQLPAEFEAFLVGASVEETDARIVAFETAWQAAIKKAVDEKFKQGGGDPGQRKNGGGGGQKKWNEMTLTEQGNLAKEDVELARKLAKEAGARVRF
jgi:hypothetical protein